MRAPCGPFRLTPRSYTRQMSPTARGGSVTFTPASQKYSSSPVTDASSFLRYMPEAARHFRRRACHRLAQHGDVGFLDLQHRASQVRGGNYVSHMIEDRCGDAADSRFVLLNADCVAHAPDLSEFCLQSHRAADGFR